MAKFNVGDKCSVNDPRACSNSCSAVRDGGFVIITEVLGENRYVYDSYYSDGKAGYRNCSCYNDKHLDLVEAIKKGDNIITNLMDKFMQLFEGEPTKSYKKAGIYDSNGVPTDVGMKMFMKYVLDNKSDLSTAFQTDVVAKLVAEQEKDSKK